MTAPDPALADALVRLADLRRELQGSEPAPVGLIETHISWVLLGAARAWKLKKPLRLPFLDMRSLSARRHSCEEELRLNSRLAPALYLHVAEVHGSTHGASFEGDGPVVDVAVCMRRFPDGALWSEQLAAGRLRAHHVDKMAIALAQFHDTAPPAPPDSDWGSPAVHARTARGLIAALDQATARPELSGTASAWPPLRDWLGQAS